MPAREPDAGAQAGTPLEALMSRGRKDATGTAEDPIDVEGDLDRAVTLLGEGKHVRLNQADEVSTLIGKLGKVVNDARTAGRTPPKINLCNVTVAGTNLFCVGNKGQSRLSMPQLVGVPRQGSPAAELTRNEKGFVDVKPLFEEHLTRLGIKVTDRTRPSNHLRATQAELDGGTVARIASELEAGTRPTPPPLYVTRDGYILDGHHNWAAGIAIDAKDGRLGDVQTDVRELDLDIGAALTLVREFTADAGIEPQDAVTLDPAERKRVLDRARTLIAGFVNNRVDYDEAEGRILDATTGLPEDLADAVTAMLDDAYGK